MEYLFSFFEKIESCSVILNHIKNTFDIKSIASFLYFLIIASLYLKNDL